MASPSRTKLPIRLLLEFGAYALASLWLAIWLRAFLAAEWGTAQADVWFLAAALMLLYQWAHLSLDLRLNRREDQTEVLASLGLASAISLIRLVSIAFLLGFLFLPEAPGRLAWLPAFIYLAAILSDLLDGYAARVTNRVTELGQRLDELLDGRGLMLVSLLAWHYGRVGWWYLVIGLARYLYLLGLNRRTQRGQPIYDLQPNMNRRALAGTQMVFSQIMLVPLFSPPETVFVSTLFMIPFLGNFLVDWWQVSGNTRALQGWRKVSQRYFQPLFPAALCLTRAVILVLVLLRALEGGQPIWVNALELTLAAAIALGWFGRAAAALLLVETGLRQQLGALGPLDWAIFFFATLTLFFGTGPRSLRSPEGQWVQKRAGEKLDGEQG